MLELREIRKSFQIGPTELEVLKGANLRVDAGELVSIIGESGSGKSTLMNVLGLLDKPTSGEYVMDGMQVSYRDDDMLSDIRNRKIGFVFQSYHLLPRLDALENVGLPLAYRGITETEVERRAMEMLERVGMEERADHRPSELSGGQQQRIAVARALIGRPSIVLADEPTGALDAGVGQEIMGLFKQLNEEEHVTIIIITHDAAIAAQCNRIISMREGVLVEQPSLSGVRPGAVA